MQNRNFSVEQILSLRRETFVKMKTVNMPSFLTKQVDVTNVQEMLDNLAFAIMEAHTLLADIQKRAGYAPRDCEIVRGENGKFRVAVVSLAHGGEPLSSDEYVKAYDVSSDRVKFPWNEDAFDKSLLIEWASYGRSNQFDLEGVAGLNI